MKWFPKYSENWRRRRENFWRKQVHAARPANVLYWVREPDPKSVWVEYPHYYVH